MKKQRIIAGLKRLLLESIFDILALIKGSLLNAYTLFSKMH